MLDTLDELEIFSKAQYSSDDGKIQLPIEIDKEQKETILRWINDLLKEGIVREEQERIIKTGKKIELSECVYEVYDYFRQLKPCLQKILTGEENALDVFYEKNQELAPNRLISKIPGNDEIIMMLLRILEILTVSNKGNTVQILEIGTRDESITRKILENLKETNIVYTYTDTSQYFLQEIKTKLEGFKGIEYELLDLNRNLTQGKLLIIEATKESYALLTSLELKGGLDQFTDDRRDNDIIFNSKHSWEEKLKVSGFNVKFILPSDEDTIAENGQTIFFCTKGDNAFNITENYIKTFLKERLPEYMIPRNIRFMENIPLNVNNKIDRRLLLTMSQSIRETKMTLTNLEEKENLNQNEKIISSIWKEILGIEYVNKKDNFYSVGGDSLLIAQVVTKMRKSIKQLENISWDQLMREVLENPTLEGMSNIISQKEHSIQKMQKTSMSKYIHKYNETENAPVKVISFFHAGTGRLIDYKHMVENLLDLYNNVGLLTSDPTTLLLPKSIAVVEENVS